MASENLDFVIDAFDFSRSDAKRGMSHHALVVVFNQIGEPNEMRIACSPAGINDCVQIVGHIRFNVSLKSPGQQFPNEINGKQQFILLEQFIISGFIIAGLFDFRNAKEIIALLN